MNDTVADPLAFVVPPEPTDAATSPTVTDNPCDGKKFETDTCAELPANPLAGESPDTDGGGADPPPLAIT